VSLASRHLWERKNFDSEQSPDVQLRKLLTTAKRAGRPFFPAWVAALDEVEWGSRRQGTEWREALEDSKVQAVWFAAYCDLPDPPGEACSLLNVADAIDYVRTSPAGRGGLGLGLGAWA
jgi:hypothetical protein